MIIVPPGRKIYIAADLTEESTTEIIQAIHRLDVPNEGIGMIESEKKLNHFSAQPDPIELVIDSYGGEIYSMFAIYDAIRQASCPVHTLAIGKVMSASVLLLAAGEKGQRRSGLYTTFMVHEASVTDMNGKVKNIEDYTRHIAKMDDDWYDAMNSLTNQSVDWKKLCEENEDYYFNADQAKTYEVIDEIL